MLLSFPVTLRLRYATLTPTVESDHPEQGCNQSRQSGANDWTGNRALLECKKRFLTVGGTKAPARRREATDDGRPRTDLPRQSRAEGC